MLYAAQTQLSTGSTPPVSVGLLLLRRGQNADTADQIAGLLTQGG
jgi:hypothetical protein